MKIFISYSRRDSDFAQQIYEYFKDSDHDVFTDVNNIQLGDIWSDTIENNISNCDIFVIIVTQASLRSQEVEKELLQAQREKKLIIPVIHRSVKYNEMKWNLNRFQGIEFEDKYELARTLYLKITKGQEDSDHSISRQTKKVQVLNVKRMIPVIIAAAVIVSIIVFIPGISPLSNKIQNAPPTDTNKKRNEEYAFLKAWGSSGVINPGAVAVDSSDHVYVADVDNDRIQKFDSNGAFITAWGSYGNGSGQFIFPLAVAVDSSGNVYVGDRENHRIQKFDSNGAFITAWGSQLTNTTQMDPLGIAVNSSGIVFVANSLNNNITIFNATGKLLKILGSKGKGDGQFDFPQGIAVDSSGNVYVADMNNNRIQKFDSNGVFIMKWGTNGNGDGQFNHPQGIAIDSSDNVYVADMNNNRIQKFDSDGTFITAWGSQGTSKGQFNLPQGIAVDSRIGNVYVADRNNNRIQVFARKV